jgi:hypothetical protein
MITLVAAQFEFITDVSALLADHSGGEAVAAFELPDHDTDHDQGHDGCDHCCHGAGHMNAIVVSAQIVASHATPTYRSTVPVDRTSLVQTPPIRPPIA